MNTTLIFPDPDLFPARTVRHFRDVTPGRQVADPARLILWAAAFPEDAGLHAVFPPDAWEYR